MVDPSIVDPGSDRALSPMRPAEPPDGYPSELEQWITLGDGGRVFVRPIVPADVARLEYAFAHADIDTLQRRFFTAAPPTDRAHLEYLATVNFVTRLALLAMDEDGTGVAISRYERSTDESDDDVAEVAIVVAPEWRRRGVGAAMVAALEPPAAANGFRTLTALYLPSNKAVERLLSSIGYGERTVTDGIAVLTKRIGRPVPSADARP